MSEVYYHPSEYGYKPECSICGITIQPGEDWEGDRMGGAQHRFGPSGCAKALGRELGTRPRCPYCGEWAPYGDERIVWLNAHTYSWPHSFWCAVKRNFRKVLQRL